MKIKLLTSICLSIFSIQFAQAETPEQLMNRKLAEIANLNQYISLKGGQGSYQDSNHIRHSSSGINNCSTEVIKTETRSVPCDEGHGNMTQTRNVYGTDSYNADCSTTTASSYSAWTTTDKTSCSLEPLCSFNITSNEDLSCSNGKTGSITVSYNIKSNHFGKHVSPELCSNDTTRIEISRTDNCIAETPEDSGEVCETVGHSFQNGEHCSQYIGMSNTRDNRNWIKLPTTDGSIVEVYAPDSHNIGYSLVNTRIKMMMAQGNSFFQDNGFTPMTFGTQNGQVSCFLRNNDVWNNGEGWWRLSNTPDSTDTDSDGITDGMERQYGLDFFVKDFTFDYNQELLERTLTLFPKDSSNFWFAQFGFWHQLNTVEDLKLDADQDGVSTGLEVLLGLNPKKAKTDDTTNDIEVVIKKYFKEVYGKTCTPKEVRRSVAI